MKNLITLKQQPIIEFSEMEARGVEVSEKIKQLNLDTIEETEENRSMMKKMRSELNKELEVFEDQRKMIHAAITKPYKDFTSSYELNIKTQYVDASSKLKEKISTVESVMLDAKKSDITAYFNGKSGSLDFLKIEDVCLNIILSASNKKLRDQVDVFIDKVGADLLAINGMKNTVRIESIYKMNLDLSLSVSTVNADIKLENKLEARKIKAAEDQRIFKERRAEQDRIKKERDALDRVEKKKKEAEQLEQQRITAEKNAELNKTKETVDEAKRLKAAEKRTEEELKIAEQEKQRIADEKQAAAEKQDIESKIHKMKFTVCGNMKQLKEIKTFMEKLGVTYE